VSTERKGSGRSAKALLLVLLTVLGSIALWQWGRRPPQDGVPEWVSRISESQRESRPDILFVVYDARRRDDFSFGDRGNSRGDTPFLATFQEDALTFEAVSPATWTIPAHASIFSGLTACDLGIDHYNPGFAGLSLDFLSLAEILALAGYQTIASADHPFFFNESYEVSLVRGFLEIGVVADFERYELVTNVGASPGTAVRRRPLEGLPDLARSEIANRVASFNKGDGAFGVEGWDYDEDRGIYLPDLYPLYAESPYFARRYGTTLEVALPGPDRDRPLFLFVNLHMSTIALPDPALFSRFVLRTLMGNARARGVSLDPGPEQAGIAEVLALNASRLGLETEPFPDASAYLKHVFDNRFYDATFRGLWELLERRGLTRRMVAVVASDHGMSLGERGETFYLHEGARPHEYITRVPLILRFPDGMSERRLHARRPELVSLTDLFPTLLELGVGTDVFERELPIRGRSLLERVRENRFESLLVSESSLLPAGYDVRPDLIGYAKAVYENGEKLVYAPEPYRVDGLWPNIWRLGEPRSGAGEPSPPEYARSPDPWVELYDLTSDPREEHDLAAESPQRIRQIVDRLRWAWPCLPLVSSPNSPAWDGKALETIRALGYIQ